MTTGMSSLPLLTRNCIKANPDIAGVGVRASVYVQNFLGLLVAGLYFFDGEIDDEELDNIASTAITILTTSCAIIISAFIQARTFGLSVYHAVIILNLSWMNNTHFAIYVVALSFNLLKPQRLRNALANLNPQLDPGKLTFRQQLKSGRHRLLSDLRNKKILRLKVYLPVLLGVVHLWFVGGLGIWLWTTIHLFGDSPQCTPQISEVLFGHDILVTNRKSRRISLAIYWITVLPVLNILTILVVVAFIPILIYLVLKFVGHSVKLVHQLRRDWIRTVGFLFLALILFIDLVFTVDTELVINHNHLLVQEGEQQWTFGQTLALAVVFVPIWELIVKIVQPKGERAGSTSSETRNNETPAEQGEEKDEEKKE